MSETTCELCGEVYRPANWRYAARLCRKCSKAGKKPLNQQESE